MDGLPAKPPGRYRRHGLLPYSPADFPGALCSGPHPSRTAGPALYVNVTFHPTAQWVLQQLLYVFPYDTAPRHLLFDRDSIFSLDLVDAVQSFGIQPVRTSWRSPWQNDVVERWMGNCRRELLDHIIVFNERHAMKLLREYIAYYNVDRRHLTLGKDSPVPRAVPGRSSKAAHVVALPRVGGRYHRYEWQDAA